MIISDKVMISKRLISVISLRWLMTVTGDSVDVDKGLGQGLGPLLELESDYNDYSEYNDQVRKDF